ncbi:restriction endonuclease [Streptomyces gilvus]|uniref:nSTAND3 domain-containing NTPase n=1 Tax=Streptomyces gilvus TaxID=2920937 RepID=UPI001F0E6B58|nr:restriction endonuclease [Streptomyces sp. CME 23]MCH5676549.1 restriction endonuclease [Streptomyces sp. CME 23]
MARNYGDLSPYDFEVLVRDILQSETGQRLETFPPGRDGGIDVRLYRDNREELIVQCKHSPGRNFSAIKGELKKEAAKVSGRFNCRYILASSASLTRANKKEISSIFSGVNLAENDVWGVDDLENYLRIHPGVEQANFKLWITSTAVLQRLLHSEVYERSAGLVEQISARTRLYVQNDAFPHAQEILEKYGVCLISGQPGIGKTTLAEMLLLRALSGDWSVYVASEDIADIEKVWRRNEKQIFFYDDFLGQNSLVDKLNKNEDSRLAQVIKRIQAAPDKRLILTTREYILRQARQTYEPLRRVAVLDNRRFILDLRHYTRYQKAHILYNHIHFSGMSSSARRTILDNQRYRKLIEHRNYNPRLIELITASYDEEGAAPLKFSDYAESALDDPAHLWETIYEDQLSDVERNLLAVLSTFQAEVDLGDLEEAVLAYESACGAHHSSRRQIMAALKRLQGTFVTIESTSSQTAATEQDHQVIFVGFSNPSFSDYVCGYLSSRESELDELIDGCVFFEQLTTIWTWAEGSIYKYYLTKQHRDSSTARRMQRIRPRFTLEKFTQALFRTREMKSSIWNTFPKRPRRESFSQAERDRQILRMDGRSERVMLSMVERKQLIAACLARLEKASAATMYLYLESEIAVIKQLAATVEDMVPISALRDKAMEVCANDLSSPEDFEYYLQLLSLPGAANIPDITREVEDLRRKFISFVSEWDEASASDANTVSDCEDAVGRLLSVAAELDVQDAVITPTLDASRARFQEEEDRIDFEEDRDYEERMAAEDLRQANEAEDRQPLSLSDLRGSSENESIDNMFDTLR